MRNIRQEVLTFKFHPGHQVLMGRDGVDALPLAEVPYLASIVTTASCDVVSAKGWRKNTLLGAGVCTQSSHVNHASSFLTHLGRS